MQKFKKEAASGRFFFRKENRLQVRADFLRVYGEGKPFRGKLLHVFVLAVPAGTDGTLSPPRLGITVTRKAGNSVRRNRVRRLIRESFRLMLPELNLGYWIVVNGLAAGTRSTFAAVDSELRMQLTRAAVLPDVKKGPAL